MSIVSKLRASNLFRPDLPRRDEPNAGVKAIALVPDWRSLQGEIRALATSTEAGAVAVLAEIWQACPVSPLRIAAGHALLDRDSDEARAVLEAGIEDSDDVTSQLAVRAYFQHEDPFDRLEPFFRGRSSARAAVLRCLRPVALRGPSMEPVWIANVARYLTSNPRWLELAARLCRDFEIGSSARRVLRSAPDAKQVDSALRRHAPPRLDPVPRRRPAGLFARYRAGEHIAVWAELESSPPLEDEALEEATELARETIGRLGRNLELLVSRLHREGWTLTFYGPALTPPAPSDVDFLERQLGARVPPSLRGLWETFGSVSLAWDYNSGESAPDLLPGLALDGLDPLVIASARLIWDLDQLLFEELKATREELREPFSLSLSMDAEHKQNVSGGPNYSIELPTRCAEPTLLWEKHNLALVPYLRHCLRWAGFARLGEHADHPGVAEFVARMTNGMEPF